MYLHPRLLALAKGVRWRILFAAVVGMLAVVAGVARNWWPPSWSVRQPVTSTTNITKHTVRNTAGMMTTGPARCRTCRM